MMRIDFFDALIVVIAVVTVAGDVISGCSVEHSGGTEQIKSITKSNENYVKKIYFEESSYKKVTWRFIRSSQKRNGKSTREKSNQKCSK